MDEDNDRLNESMEVEDAKDALQILAQPVNPQEAIQRFHSLLKKTEDFSHCLSSGDIEAAGNKINFFYVKFLPFFFL